MGTKLKKIDPEQFEREQRLLFEYGEIEKTSVNSGIRYNTLTKQLNPETPTPSPATEFLNFLAGCYETRPGLEESVWALVCKWRRMMLPDSAGSDLGEAMEACGNFVAVAARSEDGHRTAEELEAARQEVLETVGKVPLYRAAHHLRNAG